MRDLKRVKEWLPYAFSLVVGQYLRETLAFVHMVICKISPEMFAFIAICILAVAASIRRLKSKQPTEQD